MIVDSIKKGIVIDHIQPAKGVTVLEYLDIDLTKETVALIMNATSKKNLRKDIIKIENVIDINLDVIGLVDPGATVNIIEDFVIKKKIKLALPARVENVIICKNPRCVTSVEVGIPQIFTLVDAEKHEYKCEYCDEIVAF